MTPADLRAALAALHWTQRGLAAILDVNERQVRRWAQGATIPQPITEWLAVAAEWHTSHPPPNLRRYD